MRKLVLFLLASVLSVASTAHAQSRVSYDISGGSGSRDGQSYTEIHLGLNWFVQDHINWRNSVFTQFGDNVKSIYGLDTAALFNADFYNSGRTLGIEFYAGPGLRFASEKSNAGFGKAGIVLALGGIRLGVGVQALHYWEDRQDPNNATLPKDEIQTFITVAGGGSF